MLVISKSKSCFNQDLLRLTSKSKKNKNPQIMEHNLPQLITKIKKEKKKVSAKITVISLSTL